MSKHSSSITKIFILLQIPSHLNTLHEGSYTRVHVHTRDSASLTACCCLLTKPPTPFLRFLFRFIKSTFNKVILGAFLTENKMNIIPESLCSCKFFFFSWQMNGVLAGYVFLRWYTFSFSSHLSNLFYCLQAYSAVNEKSDNRLFCYSYFCMKTCIFFSFLGLDFENFSKICLSNFFCNQAFP